MWQLLHLYVILNIILILATVLIRNCTDTFASYSLDFFNRPVVVFVSVIFSRLCRLWSLLCYKNVILCKHFSMHLQTWYIKHGRCISWYFEPYSHDYFHNLSRKWRTFLPFMPWLSPLLKRFLTAYVLISFLRHLSIFLLNNLNANVTRCLVLQYSRDCRSYDDLQQIWWDGQAAEHVSILYTSCLYVSAFEAWSQNYTTLYHL